MVDDNFRVIYKILNYLKENDWRKEPERFYSPADALYISPARFVNILRMLLDAGLIEGITVDEGTATVSNPRITEQGLEYLRSNKHMKRAARTEWIWRLKHPDYIRTANEARIDVTQFWRLVNVCGEKPRFERQGYVVYEQEKYTG